MRGLNDELSDFARAIVRGAPPSAQIDASYRNYTVDVAIEVYRNNYRGNLHDALAGAYPVVEQLVGKDFFRHVTRHYIANHPPHSANLYHYGAAMAGLVAAFEPARELPYLADVAALEWACQRAYFADDAAMLDFEKLALIPPEQYPELLLFTHSACQMVRSRYPINAIWQAHQPGADSDFHIDLDSGPCIALVSRKDDVVLVNEIPEADADWLQCLQAGSTLDAATADTLERHPDFDLPAALLQLVGRHVLTGFSTGTGS